MSLTDQLKKKAAESQAPASDDKQLPTDLSGNAQAGMTVNDSDLEARAQELAEQMLQEQAVVRPKGVYCAGCNMIHIGSGQSYRWPVDAPFDMSTVRKQHVEKVEAFIEGLVSRGLAEVVK